MKDMTVGSPFKHVIYFTIPLLLGNFSQQLYTLADTVIVGRTLGTSALGSIGAVVSLIFFIQGFVIGMGSGLSIVLAQRFGSKNNQRIHDSYVTSMWIAFVFSAVISLVSILLSDTLLMAIKIPQELYSDSKAYFTTTMFGLVIVMGFNFFSNVMRAMGSTTTLLLYTILSYIFNFIFDVVLIVVFSFGVVGVAIATMLSQIIVSILIFRHLSKHYPVLKLNKNDWKVKVDEWRIHLTISVPIGMQNSIISIGNIILQFKLNELSLGNIEAHAIATRLEGMITAPMMTIGVATATFVAQNYGAGLTDRIWQGIRTSLMLSVTYGLLTGSLVYFKGSTIISWLVGATNETTMNSIEAYFKMTALFYVFLGVLFVLRYSLQGMGRTIAPTISGLVEMSIRTVMPLVFVGAIGFPAIAYSHPVAWFSTMIILIIATYLFIKGDRNKWWKRALTR